MGVRANLMSTSTTTTTSTTTIRFTVNIRRNININNHFDIEFKNFGYIGRNTSLGASH